MEKISLDPLNILYVLVSLITFILSWVPEIESGYRIALLIASIILLSVVYFSSYFNKIRKNERRIEELEKKLEKIEDLINIKSDIKLLKEIVLK